MTTTFQKLEHNELLLVYGGGMHEKFMKAAEKAFVAGGGALFGTVGGVAGSAAGSYLAQKAWEKAFD